MAYNVTSEWDDIHRKMGNYEPLPVIKSQAEHTKENIEAMEAITDPNRVLESKIEKEEKEEIDSDDMEEDKFFEEYKRKQLERMGMDANAIISDSNQGRKYFGYVKEITSQEYVAEVNNAGEGISVLLNFYQDYFQGTVKINEVFEQLCKKYPFTKFVKSISTKCVPNFPDSNLPYILYYRNSKLVRAFLQKDILSYRAINETTIEHMFAEAGIPEFAEKRQTSKTGKQLYNEKLGINRREKEDFSSEEDEREDKQFISNKVFMKF
jgi:hypothetical protein